nr:hypothetical protein B0A51_15209 [Rachicladosporium sp. CCFEE 5018]
MAPAAYASSQYNTVYPASFSQNSASGTRDIVNRVTTILRSNPNACIILEGYSQGAAATVDAMSELTGASYDAVKGVLLFGNPKHKSGLACNVDQNGGTTTLNVNGISASRYSAGIPANWVAKTLDVCNYGDGVCDTTHGRGINAEHLEYPRSTSIQRLSTNYIHIIVFFATKVTFFAQDRGWGLVVSTLPFLGLFVGVCFALTINLANQPRYARAVDANGGKAVPEARLPPMIIGGVLFVIGLFWFGWTAVPGSIPWIVPVVATAVIGAGFNVIFQQCINFLVDTYALHAASAVSANTFLRSLMGSGLPLAAKPMFNALGVGPAMSILGAVAVLALPAPVLFMKYGKRLRAKSRFTEEGD